MNNPIYYLTQSLHDNGFNDTEIVAFLTLIYNNLLANKDLESQVDQTENRKYIDAYALFSDDIYILPISYWNEWATNKAIIEYT